jgi:hypothetical protein
MPFGRNRGTYSPRSTAGCLVLFALPFGAIGITMSGCAGRIVAEHRAVQSWVETPATITKAELKVSKDDEGTSYEAIAEYAYAFGGQNYTGTRVSVGNGGGPQRRYYNELQRHLDQKRPFRAYVNPRNPTQAILYRDLPADTLAMHTLFGVLFGSVGLGLVIGGLIGYRQEQRNRAPDPPPEQPWLARNDWARGRIPTSGAAVVGVAVMPFVIVYWFLASAPLMLEYPVILGQNFGWWKWLTLLFPVLGALLAFGYFRLRARRQKYGNSVFEMASAPGVVGGQLAGVIRIPRFLNEWDSFRLRLLCIDKKSNKNSEDSDKVVWHDERIVDRPVRNRSAEETSVPVLFAIPFEAAETTADNAERPIEWKLEVTSAAPGADYREEFDVPVFKTPDSRPDFQLDESLAAEFSSPPDPDAVLREDRILREPLTGGGVRLMFPSNRTWKTAAGASFMALVWAVAIWFLMREREWIFAFVFGLAELLTLTVALHLWFSSCVIEASPDGISLHNTWFGFGKKRWFAADEIESLSPIEFMSSNTIVWTRIQLVTTAGKKKPITRGLRGRLVERTVLGELNRALGRPTVSEAQASKADAIEK